MKEIIHIPDTPDMNSFQTIFLSFYYFFFFFNFTSCLESSVFSLSWVMKHAGITRAPTQ